MSEATLPLDFDVEPVEGSEKTAASTFNRVFKYTIVRVVALFFTILVGVYLTILIANMGGYVDEIRRGAIREIVSVAVFADKSAEMRNLSSEEKNAIIEERVALAEKRLGLDQPFILRSFGFLWDAIRLDLGQAELMFSDSGSKTVRLILLERLPSTLVLWGIANLILFFLSLFIAMVLFFRGGLISIGPIAWYWARARIKRTKHVTES